jgi:hypothetical protein
MAIGSAGVVALLPPAIHVSTTVNQRFRFGGTIPVKRVPGSRDAESPVTVI